MWLENSNSQVLQVSLTVSLNIMIWIFFTVDVKGVPAVWFSFETSQDEESLGRARIGTS